ncbi:MAG: RidA family protein [Rhizobiaceae bacterium]|nr:RidA family protein [Rhizobiaceae bacterium]
MDRYHTNRRMSLMVTYPLDGTAVVLSGLVPDDTTGDVADQTRQVLRKIERLLSEAGADKSHLTHVYIWLPDISDFDTMNAVYDDWVLPNKAPARACVEARLADPRLKVEIQAFAVK